VIAAKRDVRALWNRVVDGWWNHVDPDSGVEVTSRRLRAEVLVLVVEETSRVSILHFPLKQQLERQQQQPQVRFLQLKVEEQPQRWFVFTIFDQMWYP